MRCVVLQPPTGSQVSFVSSAQYPSPEAGKSSGQTQSCRLQQRRCNLAVLWIQLSDLFKGFISQGSKTEGTLTVSQLHPNHAPGGVQGQSLLRHLQCE